MARVDELADLYSSLASLLEIAQADERACQTWFEQNPCIFEIIGYRRWLPKPRLQIDDNTYYEPDFLVQNHAGVWTVFELKRPDTAVLKNPSRRTDFQAEFSTYIQQCREYADFFLQDSHREQIETRYQADVQRLVPSEIIAGTDNRFDRRVAHDLLFDRGNKVVLRTYTEVLDAIGRELDRHSSDTAGLPGMSVSILGSFPISPMVADQVLLDFGYSADRDRFSLLLRDGQFLFRLYDHNGGQHVLQAHNPRLIDFQNGHEITLVEAEFGLRPDGFHMAAFVNRRCIGRLAGAPVPIDQYHLRPFVVGSDFEGKTPADFCATEIIVYARTLSWKERLQVYDYIDDVYSYYLSPLAIKSPETFQFRGNQFLPVVGHPTAPGAVQQSDSIMAWDEAWFNEWIAKHRAGGPTLWFVASDPLAGSSPRARDPMLGQAKNPLPGREVE